MFIKPRKVNRSSKFTPRWVATARRKKEQAASLYSMAVIQIVLASFLVVGAYRSYMAIMARNTDLSLLEKAAVPGFFIVAAVFFIRACVKNLLEARNLHRPDPDDDLT